MIPCNRKCSPVFLKEELENMGSCLGCCHHLYNYKTQQHSCQCAESDKGSLSHTECFLENSQRAVLGGVGQFAELYATPYCQQLPLLESMPAIPLSFSLSLCHTHTHTHTHRWFLYLSTERGLLLN